MLGYWTSTPQPNPFTDVLVNQQKYVVSRNKSVALGYPNSALLAGAAEQTVACLRTEFDGNITVLGSGELVRSLHRARLIDEFVLQIHPIVLGSGTKLFGDDERADLRLAACEATSTGVVLTRYQPDDGGPRR